MQHENMTGRSRWWLLLSVVAALALGGCAIDGGLEPTIDDTEEQADETRTVAWETFVGAWDGVDGSYVGVVFTSELVSPNARRFFADRQVQCVRAPCNPVREEGGFRATSRYLYLAVNGTTERYSYTLRGDTLTLRQGQRTVYTLRKAVSYCAQPVDCGAQNLITQRCVGAFTCSTEHRCAYRCGTQPTACDTNADCASNQFCSGTTCGGPGTCAARPQACTAIYNPVCGCDGRTYGSACTAASSGQRVASQGECAPAPGTCRTNADCGPASMCSKTSCGAATGTCRQITVRCSGESMPVCGCDRQTYNNACMAFTAGANVASQGACR